MDNHITVVGCGSSGLATAAHLTMQGKRVTLCDTPEQFEVLAEIERRGGIELVGGIATEAPVPPAALSTDIAACLREAQVILICTSAGRHPEILDYALAAAKPGQAFLLTPGNFGSILFRQAFDRAGILDVVIAELAACRWACRERGPGRVHVAFPPSEQKLAAFPASDTARALEIFSRFIAVAPAANVFETALNSPNVISHVAGAVLNAAPIDRGGEAFNFFLDGLSETVIQCMTQLEQERDAVLAAYGLRVFAAPSEGFMRKLMDYSNHPELDGFRNLEGPGSFRHRYVSEDASCGVAMLVSLAKAKGIAVPLNEAFLTIASAINGEDYGKTGRTLEAFGLTAADAAH